MKKKIILILTAIMLVLSTAIVCVACNGEKYLNLNKRMNAGEIMSEIVKTDIKNFTVETTNKKLNSVVTVHYTQYGYSSLIETKGYDTLKITKFCEDGKYYYMEERGGKEERKYAVTLEGSEIDKERMDYTKKGLTSLIARLNATEASKGKVTLSVENQGSFAIENDEEKIVYKDFNKTKLYIPKKMEEYKSFETTPFGEYIESEDGSHYEFRGLKGLGAANSYFEIWLKTYTIQSKFTKDGKTLPVKVAYLRDHRIEKYIIPKSIEKVFFDYNVEYKEFCYLGTKAEWESKVTVEKKPYKDVIVKCSDGDVTVKKQETENP